MLPLLWIFFNPSVLRTPPLYFAMQNTEEEVNTFLCIMFVLLPYRVPQHYGVSHIESEQKRLKDRAVYRKTLKGTIGILVVVAAISVLVATLWMPVLSIYGYSMSPTLEQGQYVVSVKNTDLKSGDIVAFWQGNKLLVKRVIAGPGQWVDIDVNGNVSVDGKALDEKYLNEKALGNCDIELPHQVSESHWFLMGDNRDTSIDSRSRAIGDISKEQIEGQIIFRIWPFDQIGSVK